MITKTTTTVYDEFDNVIRKTVEEHDDGRLACDYCDNNADDFDDEIQIDTDIDLTDIFKTLAKGAVFLTSFLLVRKAMKK